MAFLFATVIAVMELKNARMDQMKKGVKMVSFYVSVVIIFMESNFSRVTLSLSLLALPTWIIGPGGGGEGGGVHSILPYIACTGICRWTGYGFLS